MVDVLCGLCGGEFVMDGDFLEGLGFEFRAVVAVAGGQKPRWERMTSCSR